MLKKTVNRHPKADKPVLEKNIRPIIKTEFSSKVKTYPGEDTLTFGLFDLEVSDFFKCPICAKVFTTCDPKNNLEARWKTVVDEDAVSQITTAICFKCNREWEFCIFTWQLDGAFDLSFSVREVSQEERDLN